MAKKRRRIQGTTTRTKPVSRDELARRLLAINGLLTALIVHVGGECTISHDDRRKANTLQAESEMHADGSIRFYLSEYRKEAPGG